MAAAPVAAPVPSAQAPLAEQQDKGMQAVAQKRSGRGGGGKVGVKGGKEALEVNPAGISRSEGQLKEQV